MALDEGTSWVLSDDFAYIGLNPAYTASFDQMIWAAWTDSAGADADGSGAILIVPAEKWALYVQTGGTVEPEIDSADPDNPMAMFNLDPYTLGLYTPGTDAIGLGEVTDHNNAGYDLNKEKVRVDGSYKMNATTTIGFLLGYTTSQEMMDDAYDYNRSQIKLGAGVKYDMGKGQDIDVALRYIMLGIDNTDEATDTTYSDDGAYNATITGRYNRKLSENNILHLFLLIASKDYSTTAESGGAVEGSDTFGRSALDISIGASSEQKVNKTAMFFIGGQIIRNTVELDFSGETAGVDNTEFSLSGTELIVPIFFGLEGKLSENLTGRFGATHEIYNSVEADIEVGGASGSGADVNEANVSLVSIGASYVLEKFQFDFVVNKQLFTDGPDFLSGAGSANNISTNFLVVYKLD